MEGALIPYGHGRVHAFCLHLQNPGILLVMQHHSSLYLIYAINPLKVVMKFDFVPEYLGMGIVRKLNILEEAPASFAVVQFGVTSPLSCKLA